MKTAAARCLLAITSLMVGACAEDDQTKTVEPVSTESRAEDLENVTVLLLPRWKVGDEIRFEVIKASEDARGGQTVFRTRSRSTVEVKVLRAGENGFVLSWTLVETTFDDRQLARKPVVQRVLDLTEGLRVVLEVDSKGSITGVQNWEDVKSRFAALLETRIQEMRDSGRDEDSISKIRAETTALCSTKEQIERLCTGDIAVCFAPLGKSFSGSHPVTSEGALANPLGGEPLPCKSEFVLKSVDNERRLAVIRWKQTIPPEDARRILEQSLRDLGARLGKPAAKGDMAKTLAFEDRAEYLMDSVSGWVHELNRTRVVKVDSRSRTESTTIRRLPE